MEMILFSHLGWSWIPYILWCSYLEWKKKKRKKVGGIGIFQRPDQWISHFWQTDQNWWNRCFRSDANWRPFRQTMVDTWYWHTLLHYCGTHWSARVIFAWHAYTSFFVLVSMIYPFRRRFKILKKKKVSDTEGQDRNRYATDPHNRFVTVVTYRPLLSVLNRQKIVFILLFCFFAPK